MLTVESGYLTMPCDCQLGYLVKEYLIRDLTWVVQVLAAGLLCNVLRFLYISLITWPWLVLPFEFVQGTFLPLLIQEPSFKIGLSHGAWETA